MPPPQPHLMSRPGQCVGSLLAYPVCVFVPRMKDRVFVIRR